jgi:hypothetical protein
MHYLGRARESRARLETNAARKISLSQMILPARRRIEGGNDN